DALGERLLKARPLGVRERDAGVVRAAKRLELTLVVVRCDRVTGDRARGALDVDYASWTEAVRKLVSGAVITLVAEIQGLVTDHLFRQCPVAVVLFDCAEPTVHCDEAIDLAVVVGNERNRTLPDQLVGMGAMCAIEACASGERTIGVVEQAGVGPAAVDDRGPVEVGGLVDHPAAVRPGERGRA